MRGRYDIYQRMYATLAEDFDYVVTLADHGEMLGEEGLWNHTYGLHEPVTQVPLVITECGSDERKRVEEPVSLLDVHATLADIAGVQVDSRGQDLRKEFTPTDRFAEYRGLIPYAKRGLREAGIDDDKIARYDSDFTALVGAGGSYAIAYDDHVDSETLTTDEARERLAALTADIQPRVSSDGETEPLDAATRDRLEELGYI
jgi:arylsulfatase